MIWQHVRTAEPGTAGCFDALFHGLHPMEKEDVLLGDTVAPCSKLPDTVYLHCDRFMTIIDTYYTYCTVYMYMSTVYPCTH